MQLYQGINRYICLQANKCEVSIFIMNVEQYLLRSRRKRVPQTRLYCLFSCTEGLKRRKKKCN